MKTLLLATVMVSMSGALPDPHRQVPSSVTDKRILTNIKRMLQGQTVMMEGVACLTDVECSTANPYLICEEETKVCGHKGVFPLLGLEIGGTALLTVLMALAVMSGIGGGGIIVPLLMAFYDMSTKQAVACSGFTILTGSICRYMTTIKKRHPDKDATCIEYSLTNVMLPTVLLGSICGVFLNTILPSLVLQILLTVLLSFLTIQSSFKAREIYRKENVEKEKKLKELELKANEKKSEAPANSTEEPEANEKSRPSSSKV